MKRAAAVIKHRKYPLEALETLKSVESEAYKRMVDKGIVPRIGDQDQSSCRAGRLHAALRLLKNMHLLGCDVNAVTY